jgi:hypothetical protein
MACLTCTTGIDHCHGTLIVHLDGLAECTEGGCTGLDRDRHDLTVACAEVSGGCGCVEPPFAAPVARAS